MRSILIAGKEIAKLDSKKFSPVIQSDNHLGDKAIFLAALNELLHISYLSPNKKISDKPLSTAQKELDALIINTTDEKEVYELISHYKSPLVVLPSALTIKDNKLKQLLAKKEILIYDFKSQSASGDDLISKLKGRFKKRIEEPSSKKSSVQRSIDVTNIFTEAKVLEAGVEKYAELEVDFFQKSSRMVNSTYYRKYANQFSLFTSIKILEKFFKLDKTENKYLFNNFITDLQRIIPDNKDIAVFIVSKDFSEWKDQLIFQEKEQKNLTELNEKLTEIRGKFQDVENKIRNLSDKSDSEILETFKDLHYKIASGEQVDVQKFSEVRNSLVDSGFELVVKYYEAKNFYLKETELDLTDSARIKQQLDYYNHIIEIYNAKDNLFESQAKQPAKLYPDANAIKVSTEQPFLQQKYVKIKEKVVEYTSKLNPIEKKALESFKNHCFDYYENPTKHEDQFSKEEKDFRASGFDFLASFYKMQISYQVETQKSANSTVSAEFYKKIINFVASNPVPDSSSLVKTKAPEPASTESNYSQATGFKLYTTQECSEIQETPQPVHFVADESLSTAVQRSEELVSIQFDPTTYIPEPFIPTDSNSSAPPQELHQPAFNPALVGCESFLRMSFLEPKLNDEPQAQQTTAAKKEENTPKEIGNESTPSNLLAKQGVFAQRRSVASSEPASKPQIDKKSEQAENKKEQRASNKSAVKKVAMLA